MKIFYSPSENGFYPEAIYGKNIPGDSIEIAKDIHKSLLDSQSKGMLITCGKDGFPVAVERVEKPTAELLEEMKSDIRKSRAPILDALTGIAGRASRAGNDSLATEADAIAELLLDITDDSELNAATTYESMQTAILKAYKRISDSASNELVFVFKGIAGS